MKNTFKDTETNGMVQIIMTNGVIGTNQLFIPAKIINILLLDITVYTVYIVCRKYMEYNFLLSQTDKRPMYQQIMEHIKQRIAVGDWTPNTPLPSIRELATAVKVSIITVKRAYMELEREGVISTQQGKGSWVNESQDLNELKRKELRQHLEKAGKLAKSLGITENDLKQML